MALSKITGDSLVTNITIPSVSEIVAGNVTVNTAGIAVGDVTVNASTVHLGNSSVNTSIHSTGVTTGDVSINASTIHLGNSSVNTSIHSTGITANGFNIHGLHANNIAHGTLSSERLPASGVVANSYGNATSIPVLTIDQYGRITNASSDLVSGITNVVFTSANSTLTVSTSLSDYNVSLSSFETYTDNAIANLVNSAPSTLDTLNELAAALGNDASFSTTVTTGIGNAYTNAVSQATSLADTAYSNATSYAATIAGTAYSNATSYAATIAGTAYSNATSYAATIAGTAYSNATSYAATIAGTAYSNAVSVASSTYLPLTGGTLSGTVISGSASPTGSTIGSIRAYGVGSAYMGASDESGRTAFFGVDSSNYAMFGALTNHDVVIRANNTEYLRVYTGGYTTMSGSSRAPVFYDSNDTGYYANPNETSVLNYTLTRRVKFIGEGGDSGMGLEAYAIYQEGGGWSSPYPDLRVVFHTGIKFGAASNYEGMRFYDDYTLGSVRLQINGGSGYTYKYTWMYTNASGMYSDTNGFHIEPNTLSTYGSMAIRGSRNGWRGIHFYDGGYTPHVMFDGSGNGGIYYESGGRWALYHYYPYNCLGVGGSATASGYVIRPNGNQYTDGYIYASAYYYTSDERKKDNITTIPNALEKILQLRGVNFTWKDNAKVKAGQRSGGLIAQEVQPIIPEAVFVDEVDEEVENALGLDTTPIVGYLVEAIKELKKEIDELKRSR